MTVEDWKWLYRVMVEIRRRNAGEKPLPVPDPSSDRIHESLIKERDELERRKNLLIKKLCLSSGNSPTCCRFIEKVNERINFMNKRRAP